MDMRVFGGALSSDPLEVVDVGLWLCGMSRTGEEGGLEGRGEGHGLGMVIKSRGKKGTRIQGAVLDSWTLAFLPRCARIFSLNYGPISPSSASRKSRPQQFRELLISDIFTTLQQTQFRLSSNTTAAELKARFAI